MEERISHVMRRNPETGCHEWVPVPTGKFKFTDEDRMLIVSVDGICQEMIDDRADAVLAALGDADFTEAWRIVREDMRGWDALPQKYVAAALVLVGEDKPDEALDECIDALRCNPEDTEAHIVTGTILFTKGDVEAGGRYIRKGTHILSGNRRVRVMQAGALSLLGESDRVVEMLAPLRDEKELPLSGYRLLSQIARGKGNMREAFDIMHEGLTVNHSKPFGRKEMIDSAEMMLQTALKMLDGLDMSGLIGRLKSEIMEEDGHPVLILEDTNTGEQGSVSYWATSDSDCSTIRYNPESLLKDYVIIHGLVELRMMGEARRSGKLFRISPSYMNAYGYVSEHMPGLSKNEKNVVGGVIASLAAFCTDCVKSAHVMRRVFTDLPEVRPLQALCCFAHEDGNAELVRILRAKGDVYKIVGIHTTAILIESQMMESLYGFTTCYKLEAGDDEISLAGGLFRLINSSFTSDGNVPGLMFDHMAMVLLSVGLHGCLEFTLVN